MENNPKIPLSPVFIVGARPCDISGSRVKFMESVDWTFWFNWGLPRDWGGTPEDLGPIKEVNLFIPLYFKTKVQIELSEVDPTYGR